MSVEKYLGGSYDYELRADGWTLIDSYLELDQTDYSCGDCGHDPSGDDGLLELLSDIDTAPRADVAA